jgi:tRNA pseudouridine38-40 synthase
MPAWKLKVEYEGTRYHGWQEQKNARTVAGEIRAAAEMFLPRPVEILGAGRTDAGVHALGQVARLRSEGKVNARDLFYGLNDRLPADINVLSVEETRYGFDPRRDALSRYYVYQISLRRTAFAKRFVWWVKDPLKVDAMMEASQMLLGRREYAQFSEPRHDDRSTIVTVTHSEMTIEGDLLLFRIGASRFLWKMVRRIVGTLVEVGRGHVGVKDFKKLVEAGGSKTARVDFNVAAFTAPPSGLFLERVIYDQNDELPPIAPAIPVRGD